MDLDLECLPLAELDTNDVVMACAVLAYNILCSMGLKGLKGKNGSIRDRDKLRCLKTVIQDLCA